MIARYVTVVSHPLSLCAVLVAVVAALYSPFLDNPLVFDDKPFFAARPTLDVWLSPGLLDFRWLPYATLAWTRELFGPGLAAFRIGNLVLHALNAALLFLFMRRLFQLSLRDPRPAAPTDPRVWLAFFAGLLFALHPVAVYAAAYLVQRSILMAALFCFLMWIVYLEGLARNKQTLLLVSALFYYLAVFSKELSIMAPAVALCLTLLLRRPSFALLKTIAPTFVLYAGIALVAIHRSLDRFAAPYEPMAGDMLAGIDPGWAFPLSVLNQSYLFFKYLLLWIVPYPGWMSIDVRVAFPDGPLSFPQVLGPAAFLLFIALGAILILRRDHSLARLAGFGMLAPALLFVTEFSTVRIQEPFVLYRSYLWFGPLFAALPALAQWVDAKKLAISLAAVGIALVPASWNRLTVFSDSLLLWSDAVAAVESKPNMPGADRIYYNRGNAFLVRGLVQEAAQDYGLAARLNPSNQSALSNLGYSYYQQRRYKEAVEEYRKAVAINPRSRRPQYGLGMSYLALGEKRLAWAHFNLACEMNYQPACLMLTARIR